LDEEALPEAAGLAAFSLGSAALAEWFKQNVKFAVHRTSNIEENERNIFVTLGQVEGGW
jgi:hypothetical protein